VSLYRRRRPVHGCRHPATGQPVGIDPGDIWRCDCGRYWRAYHLSGSRHPVSWKRITRLRGRLRTLGMRGTQTTDRDDPTEDQP